MLISVIASIGIAFEDRAGGPAPLYRLPILKNKKALKARREYEESLKNARTEFAGKLGVILKEVLSEEDLETGNRISKWKKAIEGQKSSGDSDPLAKARRRIEGTKWNWFKKREKTVLATFKFLKDNRVSHSSGRTGVWVMTDPKTAIVGFGDIYIFKFGPKNKTITIHSYKRNAGFATAKKVF